MIIYYILIKCEFNSIIGIFMYNAGINLAYVMHGRISNLIDWCIPEYSLPEYPLPGNSVFSIIATWAIILIPGLIFFPYYIIIGRCNMMLSKRSPPVHQIISVCVHNNCVNLPGYHFLFILFMFEYNKEYLPISHLWPMFPTLPRM